MVINDKNSQIVNGDETENQFDMENNANLEVNKKNSEEYEQLIKNSTTNLDNYYDKNNPVIKIILLVLGIIIVVGCLIVLLLSSMQ